MILSVLVLPQARSLSVLVALIIKLLLRTCSYHCDEECCTLLCCKAAAAAATTTQQFFCIFLLLARFRQKMRLNINNFFEKEMILKSFHSPEVTNSKREIAIFFIFGFSLYSQKYREG
jgi:hypothetical protein